MVVHAAGMSGHPRLQECQRFAAAHFADDDAVGPQPHGRAHQARQIGLLTGMQLHQILRAALDFERVLDDHVALAGIRRCDHFVDQRAAQRGLARTGAAADQDIVAARDRLAENFRLRLR